MTYREINIKMYMPTVDEAINFLKQEICISKKSNIKVVKVIHGFGSTGVGGKIRTAVKKICIEKKAKKEILDYVLGEEWSIFNGVTRSVLDKCPELRKDTDLDRHNNGVSIIVLK